MEAARPLHPPTVRKVGDRLVVDALVVEDECAVRLASESEDPAQLLVDAIEVGARILDREQVGANADFVKAEFERAARELDAQFVDRARVVAERLDARFEDAFGADNGTVVSTLRKHFGDESSEAVQHKVREVVRDVAGQMREDLRRQFASENDDNPLAAFHRVQLAVAKQAAEQHGAQLQVLAEKMEATRLEVERLRAEKEKLEEVAAEREKGTAKGRSYEEAVAEALDRLATARGDDCEAVGDVRGEGGRKGDVVIAIDGCSGPARGRIVFEVKNARLSRKEALAELDGALTTRGADYAVLVVPNEERLPAKINPLRELNGDKLFVTFDPEDDSTLALEVAYGLARARVLMARSDAAGLDPGMVRAEVERATGAMDDVRRIKSQLTNARTGIDNAQSILDAMATVVRGHLAEVELLVATAEAGEEPPPRPEPPAPTPSLAQELDAAAPKPPRATPTPPGVDSGIQGALL